MKKYKNDKESVKIINKRFYLYVLLFAIFLIASLLCLGDDWEIGLFVGVLAILLLVISLFTPTHFIFNSKSLDLHGIVFHKTIHYSAITGIIEFKPFEHWDNFPKYVIMYQTIYKGKSFVKDMDLPRSKSIKKQLHLRLKGKLI